MKAVLIATARNEAPYFLEWVAHHLEVGFTDIIIYQNDSDDLTHDTLATLRNIGAIQYYYNRAEKGQHKRRAYDRAAQLPAYKTGDWAMTLDINEFLVVKAGKHTLTDLLNVLPESDCLHLNWRLFGNSGYEVLTDQRVTERFAMADHQKRAAGQFIPYKCLFRPALFPGPNGPAISESPIRYSNGSGLTAGQYRIRNAHSTDPGGSLHAQINHYITRDLSSFMLKSARIAAGQRHWRRRNTNFDIDDSMQPMQARIMARMAALDAASGGRLAALREAAIFDHLARYYTLLQDPQMRAFRRFCKAHPNAT